MNLDFLLERYELLQEIGQGAYSTVYVCRNVETQEYLACKKFYRSKMDPSQWKLLHDEIKILCSAQCPSIIRIYNKFKTEKHFYLILEYCNGGTLEELLRRRERLTERESSVLFGKILIAVQKLREISVLHRDIKNSNILLHFPNLPDNNHLGTMPASDEDLVIDESV